MFCLLFFCFYFSLIYVTAQFKILSELIIAILCKSVVPHEELISSSFLMKSLKLQPLKSEKHFCSVSSHDIDLTLPKTRTIFM